MNKKTKNCGNCRFFTKLKNERFIRGLCEKLDYSTTSDSSHNCKHWKPIKYKRINNKDSINLIEDIHIF